MRGTILWGALLLAGLPVAACSQGPPTDTGPASGSGFFLPFPDEGFGLPRHGTSAPLPALPVDRTPVLGGCSCAALGECQQPACDGSACAPIPIDDDSACGTGLDQVCVAGECRPLATCASEEAENPTVVFSEPFVEAHPGGPRASAAADGPGRVLVVWSAIEPVASSAEGAAELVLYARRFASDGTPIDCRAAPIEIVRVAAVGWDLQPSVAGRPSGWVVTWTAPGGDGDLGGIAYQLVTAGGRLLGPIRTANTQRFFHQRSPSIAALDDGFVIAWCDEAGLEIPSVGLDWGDPMSGVRARRFDTSGIPIDEEELVVPAETDGDQIQPSVSVSGSTWLVSWTDAPEDLSLAPVIRARRFSGATPLDAEDWTVTATFSTSPATTTLGSGAFAVAWQSRADDGRGDVRGRTVPSGEGPMGSEVALSNAGNTAEAQASLASLGSGYVAAVELGDTERDVSLETESASLPAGSSALSDLLSGPSLQRDASLLANGDALWVVWSDDATQWGDAMDPVLGDPDAYRSVLLYRLDLGGGP